MRWKVTFTYEVEATDADKVWELVCSQYLCFLHHEEEVESVTVRGVHMEPLS
jgi:hypothetical protein